MTSHHENWGEAHQLAAPVKALRSSLHALSLQPRDGLLLACSGGPDSMALMLAARACFGAHPRVWVVSVDHGLRGAAARECATAMGVARRIALPSAVRRVRVSEVGNRMEAAREARYSALAGFAAEHSLAAILLGHHADDVAETVLARCVRGRGLAGLDVMPAVGYWGCIRLVRPFRSMRRETLATFLASTGVPSHRDPTNADIRYERTRMRARIQSLQRTDNPNVVDACVRLADEAVVAAKALHHLARSVFDEAWDRDVASRATLSPFDADLAAALVRCWLEVRTGGKLRQSLLRELRKAVGKPEATVWLSRHEVIFERHRIVCRRRSQAGLEHRDVLANRVEAANIKGLGGCA